MGGKCKLLSAVVEILGRNCQQNGQIKGISENKGRDKNGGE
jgi:hypothetical protein